jgi:hypothetical protein
MKLEQKIQFSWNLDIFVALNGSNESHSPYFNYQ